MDDEKKKDCDCPDECLEPKRQSKRFLVFYVIGLFCIALVLILLSYLTQVRAARQLATKDSLLTQQITVAQGAQQQMAALQTQNQELQKQLDDSRQELEQVRQALEDGDGKDDLSERVERLDAQNQAYYMMIRAESELAVENVDNARQWVQKMVDEFGDDALTGGEEPLLPHDMIPLFAALKQRVGI